MLFCSHWFYPVSYNKHLKSPVMEKLKKEWIPSSQRCRKDFRLPERVCLIGPMMKPWGMPHEKNSIKSSCPQTETHFFHLRCISQCYLKDTTVLVAKLKLLLLRNVCDCVSLFIFYFAVITWKHFTLCTRDIRQAHCDKTTCQRQPCQSDDAEVSGCSRGGCWWSWGTTRWSVPCTGRVPGACCSVRVTTC